MALDLLILQTAVACAVAAGVALTWVSHWWRSRSCYLLDYSCYRPPDERKLNTEAMIYLGINMQPVRARRLDQLWRIHLHSGLGQETCVSKFILSEKPQATVDDAREEVEETFTAVLDDLFSKTGVKPAQIDVLIVTISTFGTAPSPAAWVVNRYKMRENIKSFNLSGQGCAGSLTGVSIAKDLLSLCPESYALVLGTEPLHINYTGQEQSMMISSCLFRSSGYALLFSNRASDARRSRMRLCHMLRTTSVTDDAYGCVTTTEDDAGMYGISIQRCIIDVAGEAIRRNLRTLAPLVLPLREQLRYVYFNMLLPRLSRRKITPYVPNFRSAFEHFCIHPGSRAVINGVGNNLGLTDYDLEASRMALHRFGNTSTSGIWYEAAYLDAKRRLRRGDRLWQIGLGAGFDCNFGVWEVLRESNPESFNVWDDVIHRYPCDTRNPFYFDPPVINYFLALERGECPALPPLKVKD